MELIPILSLIMLVATIATFILAIGAYILYKIRERNNRIESESQKDTVQAELVTPSQIIPDAEGVGEAYTGDLLYTKDSHRRPLYTETRKSRPRMRPTYVAPIFTKFDSQVSQQPSSAQVKERTTSREKFLRYTQDGYVEPTKDENKESTLKWR